MATDRASSSITPVFRLKKCCHCWWGRAHSSVAVEPTIDPLPLLAASNRSSPSIRSRDFRTTKTGDGLPRNTALLHVFSSSPTKPRALFEVLHQYSLRQHLGQSFFVKKGRKKILWLAKKDCNKRPLCCALSISKNQTTFCTPTKTTPSSQRQKKKKIRSDKGKLSHNTQRKKVRRREPPPQALKTRKQ